MNNIVNIDVKTEELLHLVPTFSLNISSAVVNLGCLGRAEG